MMNWHGIGLISSSWAPLPDMASIYVPPPDLEPSAQWNGTAGSGFGGSNPAAPSNPTRTTAKPALRLLTPPAQYFTDTLDVGVLAMANDSGSLADNFGIESITFHCEGNSVTLTDWRWHTIQTERGARTYPGWWVRLKKPAATGGNAQLYIEATAKDGTMQKRVIGPYVFSPVAQQYTQSVTVTPSQPEVAGVNYQTLDAAANYLSIQGTDNPLITISEPGLYELTVGSGSPGLLFNRKTLPGRLNITASVPGVSIGRATYTTDAAAIINDARYKLRFFGANLTLDFRRVVSVAGPSADDGTAVWLDGVTLTSTAPYGSSEPWRGTYIPNPLGLGRVGAWLTEVLADEVTNVGVGAALVRGGIFGKIAYDAFNEASCVLLTEMEELSSQPIDDEIPAFTVHYTGGETSATIARSGGQLSTDPVIWTVTLGVTSYTFDSGPGNPMSPLSEDYYNGVTGDGYWVSDLVNWLNTLPGVTAVLQLDESDSFEKRAASTCSLPGIQSAGFGATDIKTAPLQLYTSVPYHPDWYQHNAGNLENVIVAFNRCKRAAAQMIFLLPFNSGTVPAERDVFFVGNVVNLKVHAGGSLDTTVLQSQFGRGTGLAASHVVIAHNTLANQGFLLRTVGIPAGFTADSYCLVKNNCFKSFGYDAESPLPNLVVDGLHLYSGAALPAATTDVVIGGDASSLFVDAAAYDFRPAGLLAAGGFVSALPVDRNRTAFPQLAALGAYAQAASEYIAPQVFLSSSISGLPQDGEVLTANASVAGGGQLGGNIPTLSYQWKRNGTNISGQTASTITLDANAMGLTAGDTISCEITASNVAGSANAEPSVQFIGAARQALETLLAGKSGSGMYDGRAGVTSPSWEVPNISGALGSYTQTTATKRPTISLDDGLKFDGVDDLVNAPSVGGTYTMLVLMRKAVGDDNGHIIQNFLYYINGSGSAGPANTFVDGAAVTTRGAVYTALNDGLWHIVEVREVAAATVPILGHPTGSPLADMMVWVVLREDQFGDIAAARTAANDWLVEEKP